MGISPENIRSITEFPAFSKKGQGNEPNSTFSDPIEREAFKQGDTSQDKQTPENTSIFNQNKQNAAQQFEKLSAAEILKRLKVLDLKDDGKINGSVFKNKSVTSQLDMLDDNQQNGSVEEFISYLKDPFESGEETDENLAQGYNIFKNLNKDDSLSSLLEDIKTDSDFEYSPNEFNSNANRFNYNYSVNPSSIVGNGVTQNAVRIALSQIGSNETDGSYLKYSQGRREAWCADFASWAYEKANGKCPWGYRDKQGSYKASVEEIKDWAGKNKRLVAPHRTNVLKPGDMVLFGQNGGSHIAIITKVDAKGIHTIEGNTSDRVAERTYNPKSKRIFGYIKMG